MAELEKCIKCNKNTENEDIVNYQVKDIWDKDKDGERIKKLEGGIHCLDCWKQVEKDYRWYASATGYDVLKKAGWRGVEPFYFNWKKNQWCSVVGSQPDPDVPISPNDKIPNYWVGCLKCDWERELEDDKIRVGVFAQCEKCHSDVINIYPADKRKNKNNRDDRRDENNPEKQELEQHIAQLQQTLKAMKNYIGEYQKQQLEKQLSEAIEKYKAKFGELPSSLREDVGGGGGGWEITLRWKRLCAVDRISGSIGDYCRNSCLFPN